MGVYHVEIRKPRGCKSCFPASVYPGFKWVKDGKYAYHWEKNDVLKGELDYLKEQAKKDGFKLSVIDRSYARSRDYRKKFIEDNPGPWRCRYCRKLLKEASDMTVDHVIPVAAFNGKSWLRGWYYRRKLAKQEIDNVNDPRNLVPACKRCNSRKGQKTGLWVLRADLGAHKAYWIARPFVCLGLVVAGCGLVWWLYVNCPQVVQQLLYVARRYVMHMFF